MYRLLFALSLVVLFNACKEQHTMIYENDTDSQEWINMQTVKNIPNPHSGASASVLDSNSHYSLGFSKIMENIGTSFKEIHFSYWIYSKNNNSNLNTVFALDKNGKSINWDGHPVRLAELNKWTLIEETYVLPEKAESDCKLIFYVWNNSNEEVFIDDLKLEFK